MSVDVAAPPGDRPTTPAAIGETAAAPESWLRTRLVPAMPTGGWRGWIGPLAITILAAVLRLTDLGRPHAIVFDETYYVKDGLSLLLFGYEQSSKEGADKTILDSNGSVDELRKLFTGESSFVVHPPLGKWVIASGESVFGVTPFGWRIAVCVLGIVSALLVARITRRLTRSNLLGTIAGGLIAIDGLNIVMSRTALLDMSLMFFILVAFGCLLLDRDRTRLRLADLADRAIDPLTARPVWSTLGPRMGLRPWRLAAGISLGLACGVKWSGIYYVLGFGLLTVLWDVGARRLIGVKAPWRGAVIHDALPAFAWIVGVAFVAYLATWTGWFMTPGGWNRNWAVEQGETYPSFLNALVSLWHYHAEALHFHTHLTSPHSYQANPWGWPIMSRPTSFYYNSPKDVCGAVTCSEEVIALGNPVIWWAGVAAVLHQSWRWMGRRDWRAGAVLCAFLAGWAPWLLFQERTVFGFYAIVFEPFIVIALTMTLGTILGTAAASENRRMVGAMCAGAILIGAVAASWFFFPIWTGDPIPYDQWNLRMWFPTWV